MSNSDWGAIPRQLAEDVSLTLKKKFNIQTGFKPVEWNNNIKALTPLPEKTVSGSVVAFPDGADDVPLKSCEVTIAPTLDGVSSVGVVHCGKNLLPPTDNDIWEVGNINASGEDTSGSGWRRTKDFIPVKNTDLFNLMMSGVINSGASDRFRIFRYDENKNFVSYANYGSQTYPRYNVIGISYIRIRYEFETVTFSNSAMIEYRQVGETEPTSYAPYVTPTTHTANLGRTIYGGEVDVVNGTGTESAEKSVLDPTETWLFSSGWSKTDTNVFYTQATHDEISFSTWSDNSILACDALPVGTRNEINNADTNMIGVSGNVGHPCITVRIDKTTCPDLASFIQYITNNQISFVYKKATPETFTFTPVPIISRLGDNTLWSDGDLSVIYRYVAGDPSFETVLSSNPLLELTGVNGTDVERTLWTYTATDHCKIKFHSNTQVRTNIGSNDGYFTVKKNDTVILTTYANTSTTTQFPIPDIELESGDTVTIIGGFDNNHTSAYFDVYSTIVILKLD